MPQGLLEHRVITISPDAPIAGGISPVSPDKAPTRDDMAPHDMASLVLLAGHLLELRFDQALRPEGLTARQLHALRYIAVNPGVTRVELAEALCTSRQAAGGIAQRLHAIRLITRTGPGPGFPVTYTLTEQGNRCLSRAQTIVVDTERAITAQLSSTTVEAFTNVLHELIGMVR